MASRFTLKDLQAFVGLENDTTWAKSLYYLYIEKGYRGYSLVLYLKDPNGAKRYLKKYKDWSAAMVDGPAFHNLNYICTNPYGHESTRRAKELYLEYKANWNKDKLERLARTRSFKDLVKY